MSSLRLPFAVDAAEIALSAVRLGEDTWDCLDCGGAVVEAVFWTWELITKFIWRFFFGAPIVTATAFFFGKFYWKNEKKSKNVPDDNPRYGIEDIDLLRLAYMTHDDRVRNHQCQEAQKP